MRHGFGKLPGWLGLAFALACLAPAARAQRPAEPVWPTQQHTDPSRDPRAPFELRLTATASTTLCRGDALGLEVEVSNTSDGPYEFEKSALWKNFSYVYLPPDGFGEGGARARTSDGERETVVIERGASLSDSYEFSLKDKFFKRPGKYELSMNVERVASNRLKFVIMDCDHIESEVNDEPNRR